MNQRCVVIVRNLVTWMLIITGLATCGLVVWKLAVVCMRMRSFEFDGAIVDGATVWLCFSDSEYRNCIIPLEPWVLGVLAAFWCVLAAFCWACVVRFWESRGTSR